MADRGVVVWRLPSRRSEELLERVAGHLDPPTESDRWDRAEPHAFVRARSRDAEQRRCLTDGHRRRADREHGHCETPSSGKPWKSPLLCKGGRPCWVGHRVPGEPFGPGDPRAGLARARAWSQTGCGERCLVRSCVVGGGFWNVVCRAGGSAYTFAGCALAQPGGRLGPVVVMYRCSARPLLDAGRSRAPDWYC